MYKVYFNNSEYEDRYLDHLNECFPDWGGQIEFDWAFKRPFDSRKPDFFYIQNEIGNVVAGSGISYRKITGFDGVKHHIAIMTGSWTLPEARGKGFFSKIIEISRKRCAENSVPFLTAFVMETNSSYRRLRDAGSFLISSSTYLSSQGLCKQTDDILVRRIDLNKDGIDFIFNNTIKFRGVGFDYSRADFISQFINRPRKTFLLLVGQNYFLVEELDNILKVLIFTKNNNNIKDEVQALANWSLLHMKKRILFYTTNNFECQIFDSIGFEKKLGYFTVLSCSKNNVNFNFFDDIEISVGDKM